MSTIDLGGSTPAMQSTASSRRQQPVYGGWKEMKVLGNGGFGTVTLYEHEVIIMDWMKITAISQ